jgi:hypothetical protein
MIKDLRTQGLDLYARTLLANPTRILFLIALLCILAVIPFRFACLTFVEDTLVSLAIILLGMSSLYYGRGFKFTCCFVYNIHKIMKNNITRIALIYSMFLMGFSQGI